LKENKVVINKDVVFFLNEKSMLQYTQEEKKQVLENYSKNEHEV
jgi:hypothetical protein